MLHHLLADAVTAAPERPALIDSDGGVLTFAELDRGSAALAGWLARSDSTDDGAATRRAVGRVSVACMVRSVGLV